jgi:hypothetical protein
MDDDDSNGPGESPEVEAALELLRRLIAARRIPMGKLDDRLGHARGYISRLMQRKMRLTYDLIISILQAIDVDPNLFFTTLYPPPRLWRSALPSLPAAGPPSSGRDVAELRALLLEQLGHALPEPEEPPPMADEELKARMHALVHAILSEDLPRPPRKG